MLDLVQIDGTRGEGGGQVVRSSLALSTVTGRPFVLENVRAKRDKPGLKRQHVTAVSAAAAICQAEVHGNELNSKRLEFAPGHVSSGRFTFRIGSAGSTTLVLQTVLPALMLADGPSTVTITGGTHNPLAPTYDFLDRVFLPVLKSMGVRLSAQLDRYGFFPVGGGEIRVTIAPPATLRGVSILDSGKLIERTVEAIVSKLPLHIAEREADTVIRQSGWKDVARVVRQVDSPGPGNVIMIHLRFERISELVTACGRRGVPAETVATACLQEAEAFLQSKVPVGLHLADQILLPTALAAHFFGQRSQFRTCELSDHSLTHIEVIQHFLDVLVQTDTAAHGVLVTIVPKAAKSVST